MNPLLTFRYWITALLLLAPSAFADVRASLSSQFLARGESAFFEIIVTEGRASGVLPAAPVVPDVTIQAAGSGARPIRGMNRFVQVFQYLVSSYKEGRHVIPAMTLEVNGQQVTTQPVEFQVFNPDSLQWKEMSPGGQRYSYAASFHILKDQPYENEVTPVELKLYVPADLPVEDWGVPEFERENITCWRFEPSNSPGRVNLLGRPYIALAYPSVLAATRSGSVAVGPAKLRLVTQHIVSDGFLRRDYIETFLQIPALNFNARKLPAGAPEGYHNAVGRFTLDASSSLKEIRQGDPVTVELTISGTGNLDSLEVPRPVNSKAWKLYDSSARARGEERRETTGTTTFEQLMRPLEVTNEIPAFRLVYFDPELAKYETITTQPIPLKVIPTIREANVGTIVAPPQAAGVPVEKMTDILGLMKTGSVLNPTHLHLPAWTAHAVAGLLALLLLVKSIWMRIGHRFSRDPQTLARRKALRELERQSNSDSVTFLRKAGHFIEEWLGDRIAQNNSLREVLQQRDSLCYRKDSDQLPNLDRRRRSEILSSLRKALPLLLVGIFFCFPSQSQAAESAETNLQAGAMAAYDQADYERSIQLWLDAGPFDRLSPDTLYNIGNASYRLGAPGYAALYYRRALDRQPSHAEARQNLRFLERKLGSVTVSRQNYQYILARLDLSFWKNLVWTGSWMIVIAILTFTASRSASRVRIPAIIALIFAPILILCGALAWYYYPDDSNFAPPSRQAVVIAEKSALRTDASRTSPEVIEAPQGSLCEILEIRGDWAYVGFATKSRGWIPVSQIEKLRPDHPPKVPKVTKPDADENSA